MTTQSWSTRVRHDSDATFREWGLELNTKLAAAGLVQTADTGQINWTTVVRAGTNTNAGYEIWQLNDSLFGTAPIYFRIDYGTSGGTTNPRIQITKGTSTNGSGTLGGTCLSTAKTIHGSATQITDTARQSYLCVVSGFFGLNWKTGASATEGLFLFARTVDATGAPTATGSMVVWGGGATNSVTATQAFRYAATAQAFAAQTAIANTALCLSPQALGQTLVGADNQAMLAWTVTPAVAPLLHVCGVLDSEVAQGNTFSATLVGAVAHTYIGLSSTAGPSNGVGTTNTGGLKFAMVWE